jgi:hypothetical protein
VRDCRRTLDGRFGDRLAWVRRTTVNEQPTTSAANERQRAKTVQREEGIGRPPRDADDTHQQVSRTVHTRDETRGLLHAASECTMLSRTHQRYVMYRCCCASTVVSPPSFDVPTPPAAAATTVDLLCPVPLVPRRLLPRPRAVMSSSPRARLGGPLLWLCLLLVSSLLGGSVSSLTPLCGVQAADHASAQHIDVFVEQTAAEAAWLAKPVHTIEEKRGESRRMNRHWTNESV